MSGFGNTGVRRDLDGLEPERTDAPAGRAFATTHWSLVACAAEAGADEDAGRAALEVLCRNYWAPLRSFAERCGASRPDAEDLTQGFFADLLARGAISRADPGRGRFRTFLLASFKNYVAHERARAGRQKRGGDCEVVSFEVESEDNPSALGDAVEAGSLDRQFDRTWALSLLDRALAALRDEYVTGGKDALFDAAKEMLWSGRSGVDYEPVARRLGMSAGAVQVAVHRLRRRFAERVRAEVAQTVADPAEVEDEIRYLLTAVTQ